MNVLFDQARKQFTIDAGGICCPRCFAGTGNRDVATPDQCVIFACECHLAVGANEPAFTDGTPVVTDADGMIEYCTIVDKQTKPDHVAFAQAVSDAFIFGICLAWACWAAFQCGQYF